MYWKGDFCEKTALENNVALFVDRYDYYRDTHQRFGGKYR